MDLTELYVRDIKQKTLYKDSILIWLQKGQ